jgi:hypothetical protein
MIRLADTAPDLRVTNLRTRMPFRFGITTMTALPHLIVRLGVEVDGTLVWGLAADHLPPKWFTKNPRTAYRDDVEEMLDVIASACSLARGGRPAATPFDLWHRLYSDQRASVGERYPPLLWNFGVSLVERAVIDAFCRARRSTFSELLRHNELGIRLDAIHASLAGSEPANLLPPYPLRTVALRHTVGMTDPLTEDEIPDGERLADGLPQSLEACIRAYGVRYFKIKLSGDPDADVERLRGIAAVLESSSLRVYHVTLDGNEQFRELEPFRATWETLLRRPELGPLLNRCLFVEQPLHRDATLSAATCTGLHAWGERPPLVIDEADATLESLPAALECGYAGTSHKNCKGVFKGVANACLLEHRRRSEPRGRWLLSGEDLTNIAPVALQQDLAVMASLGVDHVERNGHHYFTGLSMLPTGMQDRLLELHPDLFHRHRNGFAAVAVRDGMLRIDSVVDSPFGTPFELPDQAFTPLSKWSFGTLGLNEAAAPTT